MLSFVKGRASCHIPTNRTGVPDACTIETRVPIWEVLVTSHTSFGERTCHIANGVALRYNKPIQFSSGTKCSIEVPCLSNGISAHQCLPQPLAEPKAMWGEETYLANHKEFIRVREFCKLLQGRHQTLCILATFTYIFPWKLT